MERSLLQTKLTELVGTGRVAFQPAENVRLQYPCVRYVQARANHKYADDSTYHYEVGYELILISKNPDEPLNQTLINNFPKIRFNRHYVSENLYHWVYILYF